MTQTPDAYTTWWNEIGYALDAETDYDVSRHAWDAARTAVPELSAEVERLHQYALGLEQQLEGEITALTAERDALRETLETSRIRHLSTCNLYDFYRPICDCGASEHNMRIDTALGESKEESFQKLARG